ncbi:hypothetical protein WQ57_09970 [Mesobacillus campisalis]|uniref:Tetrapyrrole biosynthesis glutamyl-tRNA reductase dimerisation domain-containing protein n=2 Tax=Mesobacillus campisalis TaxID=1408103 RepID=A0A0M2SZV9_9BACI|nr:hypothetical protein WQ57_09970 [Mesobacillus campisalis]
MENVSLYNIDDLHGIINSNLLERKKAAQTIMSMIKGEVSEFKHWVNLLEVVPVISALNTKASSIKKDTMSSLKRKLSDLSHHEVKVINKHIDSIVNQLLKDPIKHIKGLASSLDSEKEIDLFMKIFNIEGTIKEHQNRRTEGLQS